MAVIRDKQGNVIWNRVELPRDFESFSTGTHVLSSSRAIGWMLRVPTITGRRRSRRRVRRGRNHEGHEVHEANSVTFVICAVRFPVYGGL